MVSAAAVRARLPFAERIPPRPRRRRSRRAAAALPALLLLLAPAALSGCGAFAAERSGIVVTTDILGDVVRNVVGDQADVTVLMGPETDPHSFSVSARQAARLQDAELVVYNGLGLEEGVLRNVETAEEAGAPALAVAEGVDPVDFSAGDTAGEPDPHFWTDPVRVGRAVGLVADAVAGEVDGADAAAVRANAGDYRERVARLHEYAEERFAEIPPDRRKLVTDHHVFGYLARRYGFEVVGAVIPSGTTLASPSSSDLTSLADTVRAAGIPAVFADSAQPDRLARVMAEEAGVDVAVVPLHSESLTAEGGGAPTYLRMARSNTDAVAGALTG
ncbi:zinc ABC transporter substrate-binding protein AztC [Streptomonospora salina]|uniref:Zinc/manganese transport system substrate-binding protein n=1 Tax=Streptomonospora salina TaxID=104205 RepID=A0A841E627_9ACTN|nr:zinc ABC transporter substrate-binding protein AztC [Streptomonospora salina]MBB5996603.1 zinc/manganese transport system substrate-binding protein [Streptomonospora salina]